MEKRERKQDAYDFNSKVYASDGIAKTLTGDGGNNDNKTGLYQHKTQIRRLTPTECERLQGFPDRWTIGSDTQRYKQLGNAVSVPVVKAVGERLYGSVS